LEVTPHIAPALEELVEGRATEVLPALQTVFLQESVPSELVQETIGPLIAVRQLASHLISLWERV